MNQTLTISHDLDPLLIIKSSQLELSDNFLDRFQEQLVQTYQKQQTKDMNKQQQIKQKLNKNYFSKNKHQKRRKLKFVDEVNQQQIQMKKKLSMKLRSLIGTAPHSSRNRRISMQPNIQNISRKKQSKSQASKRTTRQSFNQSKLSKFSQSFSLQLDKIIDETESKNKKTLIKKRKNLLTLTQRKNYMQINQYNQKCKIIDKMAQTDIKSSLLQKNKFAYLSLQTRKKMHEQLKKGQLSNYQKYNMSFLNYMRYKTYNNIQKVVYNQKIKFKDSYLQKFQDSILEEYKLLDQHKLKLKTFFRSINNNNKIGIAARKIPNVYRQQGI